MCMTDRPKTDHPLEDREGEDERCLTPQTTDDSEREDDMEEIPHMLSPGSDAESDGEDDFHHNHRLGMSGTPISYTQRAGASSYLSTPEINAGSTSDIMEGSPVSSITNYTPRPQDSLMVDSSHASSKILHPPSISSSEDGSRNKGKSTITTNNSRKSLQNRKKRSKSKRKKGSSGGSFAAGVTVPHMDNHSSTSSSSYPLHISPRVALQPRMGNPKHHPSISPVTEDPFSAPSSSSSTTSKISLSSLVRPTLSGRDSPGQTWDPIGRPYPHRRSISLDIPSAKATSRKMRIWDHKPLSTLREEAQATMPIIPISYVPASETSPYPSPHQKHRHRRKASKSSSSPTAPSQHRRTVSFPDEVLQKNKFGVYHAHSNHQHHEGALQHYNDYTLESDDPALFSLVETSLSRSNGRVYIATDVDPKFISPFYKNGKGYSSSSALALTQRNETSHSASSVGSHKYSCSTTSTLTSPSVGDKKSINHADDGKRSLHIQSQQQTQIHSQKVSRKSKKSPRAKERAALGRKQEQALPSHLIISASRTNADTDTSIRTVKTGNRTKRHKRKKKKSRLAKLKGSAMGSEKSHSPTICTSRSSRFGIDQHSAEEGALNVKSQEASHCIIQ